MNDEAHSLLYRAVELIMDHAPGETVLIEDIWAYLHGGGRSIEQPNNQGGE